MNMVVTPTFENFKKQARKANSIPVSVRVIADYVTPVSLISSQWTENPYVFLLESVEGGEKVGRYSFVAFDPEYVIEENEGISRILSKQGKLLKTLRMPATDVLRSMMKGIKSVKPKGFRAFLGGAIGYCSYETVHNIERIPKTNPKGGVWADSLFAVINDYFVFDKTQNILNVVSCAKIKKGDNLKRVYDSACRRIAKNLKIIKN